MENPLEIKEGRKNLERNINFKNPLIVRVVIKLENRRISVGAQLLGMRYAISPKEEQRSPCRVLLGSSPSIVYKVRILIVTTLIMSFNLFL